ncbi:MAG: trypsin-like peptidase domain-containing protein [Rhodoferax sp.]|nr:trypsin-like peptidase domain-containing protein [Actinomycetota bacterium]
MSQTTEQSAAGTPEHPSEPQTAAFEPVQWFGTEPATPYGPPPAPPADSAFTRRDRGDRPRRRYLDMALSAVVAAVVAAGTTAVVVSNDGVQTTAATAGAATSANNGSGNPAAGTGSGPVEQTARAGVSWTPVAAAVEPSVVAISVSSQAGEAQGSGVVLDDTGRVLTNNHVVSGVGSNGQLTVTLSDGRAYSATVVGTDPSTDLAVIVMKGADKLTPATLGDSDAVKVGSPVMAVGNPLGLAGTVTTGIVSALDRPVTTTNESAQTPAAGDSGTVVTNAIQTDAAVNPGNSGGALVDDTGRVIGIPSSIASLGSTGGGSQSGSIGLGFSIPINEAKSIADQLIAGGTAEHPYLGVGLKDGSVKDGTASRTAAVVATVSAGTPAAAAGLEVGDAVTGVDGEAVNGSESLVAQIRERSVGAKVDLTVVRSGSSQQISVTLTKRPAA